MSYLLSKIFTLSIIAIVSFMLFAGFTQNQKVAEWCFWGLGVIVVLDLFSLAQYYIDSKSK